MTTRFMNGIKSVFLFCIALLGIISCEKDFEDVGVSLVDNNLFNTDSIHVDVVAYSRNIDSSRVDNLPIYNLGVHNDPNFGEINASFVTQLGVSIGYDFGLNPVIDTVIIDIPYFSTRESEDNTDGTPNFSLDSILGDQEVEYTMKVSRLATFLNTLDPDDPTRNKRYYSDETYNGSTELYSDSFRPNKNDTVLYVKRNFFEGEESIDTVKTENINPTIKLALDEAEIERIFITEVTENNVSSLENFTQYFRGFLFEAEGNDGTLMSLRMSDATFNIYYTNEILTDEDGTDLNGDGDTDDLQVPVKTKQTLSLPFLGIRTSNYTRNYTGSVGESFINAPNTVDGEENLYVQGSAGSIAEIELFKNPDLLDEIRAKNWLINGAILDIYVVDDVTNQNVPERLYLYRADENSVIRDVVTESAVAGIGGILERDDDTNRPIRYRFSITDYMSEVLKLDDALEISKLALKVYHPTDEIDFRNIDTIVRNFSWIPKGVVLRGNKDTGGVDETRLKLIIYYTENNN